MGPVVSNVFAALACAPVYILILFSFPETLRSLVGDGEVPAKQGWIFLPVLRQKPVDDIDGTQYPKPPRPTFKKFVQLLKYPPHLIVSINGAVQFAGLYAMYVTFPVIWQKMYGFTSAEVGYTYLSPGVTCFIASILVGRLSDVLRKRAVKNSLDGHVAPERRIPIQIVGFIAAACGKALYGWATRYRLHPAYGLVGAGLGKISSLWCAWSIDDPSASVGTAIIFVSGTSFQTECDPSQAASLVALGGLLRNIAAAICAVVIDFPVDRFGYGWSFTGLAVLDILCIPGILLIMWKGPKYRQALNEKLDN